MVAALLIRLAPDDSPSFDRRFARLDGPERQQVAAVRGSSPKGLRAAISGELSWIARRATAPEPQERYPSAAAPAEDLERYLCDLSAPTLCCGNG